MATNTIAGRVALSQVVPGFWDLAPRRAHYIRARRGEETVWVRLERTDGTGADTLYAIVNPETGEIRAAALEHDVDAVDLAAYVLEVA